MINLYNVDCMEFMAGKPDNYYDLAIVDPPYGLGDRLKPRGGMIGNSFSGMGAGTWDDCQPPSEYWAELFRVSINQIIWGGNYFLDHLSSTRCMISWDKMNGTNNMADFELAWTSFDSLCRRFSMHHFSAGYGKKIHPTQKPVALYNWLLHNYAKPGQRILDTHLGSGSSAIAAHYFGVEFDGCEIDPDYFAAAQKRIKLETSQMTLEF